jgi:hypothetical protein
LVAKRWRNAPSIPYWRIQRKWRRTVSGVVEEKRNAGWPPWVMTWPARKRSFG